ncbi:hypothetical protein NtB2_01691 [Lactococcus termiticola]|uniref:Uncharacterized protein n=1 Tax=Lactococcus termiticola TaxID=2169526 RepID=A0A2R5HHQ2_9LACT|nr:hypothetical protein NtB2_01691 [Lactococcus termiticola]
MNAVSLTSESLDNSGQPTSTQQSQSHLQASMSQSHSEASPGSTTDDDNTSQSNSSAYSTRESFFAQTVITDRARQSEARALIGTPDDSQSHQQDDGVSDDDIDNGEINNEVSPQNAIPTGLSIPKESDGQIKASPLNQHIQPANMDRVKEEGTPLLAGIFTALAAFLGFFNHKRKEKEEEEEEE